MPDPDEQQTTIRRLDRDNLPNEFTPPSSSSTSRAATLSGSRETRT